MMQGELSQEERKLAELILYVSAKCLTHNLFGATKLNKILFFSDFIHFKRYGRPITGVQYFKLQRGPAPECLVKVRAALEANESLVIIPRQTASGLIQHRTIARRAPNLAGFAADEIAVVDEVIDLLRDKSAGEISELSHLYVVGWNLYDLKDEIPYHSVFARMMKEEDISEHDIRRAREIARRQGLVKDSETPGS